MVINAVTSTFTGGKGEISSIDRLIIDGTTATGEGQSSQWRMDGVVALFDGVVISDINGNTYATINGTPTNLNITSIATVS